MEVLAGAEKLVAAQRPVFLVEAEARHREESPGDIFAYFDRHYYNGYFARNSALLPVAEFDLYFQNEVNLVGYTTREAADYVNNFVFLPREADTAEIRNACEAALAAPDGRHD